jgi:DNA-binding ferritin-like protein
VSRAYEESEKERVWKLLSEAGFIDITLDEFPERIKEAKHVVMGRLSELLELTTNIQERQSAAYSLAMLKKLETTLWPSVKRRSCD